MEKNEVLTDLQTDINISKTQQLFDSFCNENDGSLIGLPKNMDSETQKAALVTLALSAFPLNKTFSKEMPKEELCDRLKTEINNFRDNKPLMNCESSFVRIDNVVHGENTMKGAFAVKKIPKNSLIGTYQGYVWLTEDRDNYVNHLVKTKQKNSNDLRSYDFAADEFITYVPTDSNGDILPEFQKCISYAINEASGKDLYGNVIYPNVRFVLGSDKKIYIISTRDIFPNEELLTYYGAFYVGRTWNNDWLEELDKNSNFLFEYASGYYNVETKELLLPDKSPIEILPLRNVVTSKRQKK